AIVIDKSVFTAVTGSAGAATKTLQQLGPAFAFDSRSGRLTYDAAGDDADPIVVAVIDTNYLGSTLAPDFLIIG
ncbi:MAG TPA: hypothetical protein VEB23_13615, partial [Ramlibacter sp.]|nr:hypothetical protein [Ramlibacter sp.]